MAKIYMFDYVEYTESPTNLNILSKNVWRNGKNILENIHITILDMYLQEVNKIPSIMPNCHIFFKIVNKCLLFENFSLWVKY